MAILGKSVVAVPPTDKSLSEDSTHPVQNKEVAAAIGGLSNLTTTERRSVVGAINEHDSEIGVLTELSTSSKASIVGAVNELDSDVGNLNNLDTTNKSDLVSAVNEVKESCEVSCGAKGSITLGTTWSGNGPYTQAFTVNGYTITKNTIIDLMADETILNRLRADGVEQIYVSNDDAVLTATVVGARPSSALTINAIFSEVV